MEVSLVDSELPHCMYLPCLAYTLEGTYYFTNFRANFEHFAMTITNMNLPRILIGIKSFGLYPYVYFMKLYFHTLSTLQKCS